MIRNAVTVLLFPLLLVLSGCGRKQTVRHAEDKAVPVTLSYAELFAIAHAENYTVVTVFNPWKPGVVYDTYYLVRDEAAGVPAGGRKIQVPLKKLMVNSATHLGFLELLDELSAVSGVCDAGFIYNPEIRKAVQDGVVSDLGDAFNLNIEKLLLLRPQAVMTTAYNAEDENSKRMRQTGLNLIYNVEWQERTLLGRAEWIKFIAAFFDKSALADSIFAMVEQQYNEVKSKASSVADKPAVLSGQDYRGSWSMPGGKSFAAQLFNDAGGNYYYKNDDTTGSISTTIEEALLYFSEADVWVNVQASTFGELAKADPKYALFKAYKEGNVYHTGKRTNKSGGNDYWESGVARPDLLLSDMIEVFHPGLLPGYELTYFEKLGE